MVQLSKMLRECGVVGFGALALAQAADRVQIDTDPVFAEHGVFAIGYTHPQFKATAANSSESITQPPRSRCFHTLSS